MKQKFVLALALVASSSFAGAFDNSVDAEEAADTLSHCSAEAAQLVEGGNWIGKIEGRHTKVSEIVDRKVITFTSFRNAGLGRTESAAILKVTRTLTQRPGLADAPAAQEYRCQLKK